MPIKVKPYEHQQRAFRFISGLFGLRGNEPASTGGALLLEMGCGKTLTTVALLGEMYNQRVIGRALIICPLSITGVWVEELRKYAAYDYVAAVLEGGRAKKADTLRHMQGKSLQVVICNYESSWRLEDELLRYDADIIVLDESHRIKTHNTRQSKAVHKLGSRTRYKLALTGTPVTNKAIDVFSQYKFLNPAIFGNSFYVFRNKYFDMAGYGMHTPVLKKTKEQELSQRMHSIAFRATKAECLDLPKTLDIVRHVELEQSAMRIYKDLVKDSYAELMNGEITVTNVLTRLLRLSQLTGGYISNDEGSKPQKVSSAKMNALDDIIDDVLNEGKKLVIIARFIPEIDAIVKLLVKKKLLYSIITGSVKDRDVQVEQFQNNPDVQVFIGQIATAGLGITLTAALPPFPI